MHVVLIGADRVGPADDCRDRGRVTQQDSDHIIDDLLAIGLIAKLLVSKLTVYQTALGPGAAGGGFDATAWGGIWAQAASSRMPATAASWRHEMVRRDICGLHLDWFQVRQDCDDLRRVQITKSLKQAVPASPALTGGDVRLASVPERHPSPRPYGRLPVDVSQTSERSGAP
jgi:hypothetical protein